MVSRSLSVLTALIPAIALAHESAADSPAAEQSGLENWTIEQLCGARDRPEVLEEIERREVFDDREFRAIRRDKLRTGISEQALTCLKGSPETIVPGMGFADGNPVEAFVYPPGTESSLVVFVARGGDLSTVAAFTETEDPYAIGRMPTQSGRVRGMTCHGLICVPGTTASRQHSRVSSMSSSSPPQLPSQ